MGKYDTAVNTPRAGRPQTVRHRARRETDGGHQETSAAEEKLLLKNVMQYLRYRYARRLTYQTKQHFNV